MSMEAAGNIVAVVHATEKFAAKLGNAMKLRRFTQTELGRRVGVSAQSIHQYLQGSIPKPHTIYLMAQVLEVDLDWLVNEDNESLTPQSPMTVGELLSRVALDSLTFEIARRYQQKLIDLDCRLSSLESSGDRYDDAAISLLIDLLNNPSKNTVDLVNKAYIDDVIDIHSCFFSLSSKRELASFHERYGFMLPPPADYSDEDYDRLTLPVLQERHRAVIERHPGLDILHMCSIGMNSENRYEDHGTYEAIGGKEGIHSWLNELLALPHIKRNAKYDHVRAALGKENKPVKRKKRRKKKTE